MSGILGSGRAGLPVGKSVAPGPGPPPRAGRGASVPRDTAPRAPRRPAGRRSERLWGARTGGSGGSRRGFRGWSEGGVETVVGRRRPRLPGPWRAPRPAPCSSQTRGRSGRDVPEGPRRRGGWHEVLAWHPAPSSRGFPGRPAGRLPSRPAATPRAAPSETEARVRVTPSHLRTGDGRKRHSLCPDRSPAGMSDVRSPRPVAPRPGRHSRRLP